MPSVTSLAAEANKENKSLETQYMNGVKHLCENGISKVPKKYVLPVPDRPNVDAGEKPRAKPNIKLPVIDLSQLKSTRRPETLKSLAKACEEYGFFQVVNHGIPTDIVLEMMNKSQSFFELPFEERSKYMLSDLSAPVRYGTSFNQNKDGVFCWRDFLKLLYQPSSETPSNWPSTPAGFREKAMAYAEETRSLFVMLVEAVLESLGLAGDNIIRRFEDGSQLIVINCFPSCPEPDLTLGMPPHSDYGFLTLLLTDGVQGLQIQSGSEWVTVEPLPGSLLINVGDHLEVFSNGRYKSVLHRVLVNSAKSRISVASLHSLPYECVVSPAPKLLTPDNPRHYKDTDFASFFRYLTSCEPKKKSFLDSIKLLS